MQTKVSGNVKTEQENMHRGASRVKKWVAREEVAQFQDLPAPPSSSGGTQGGNQALGKRAHREISYNTKPLGGLKASELLHWLSVQFGCSVVSDSLWPHESQHARPPCPLTLTDNETDCREINSFPQGHPRSSKVLKAAAGLEHRPSSSSLHVPTISASAQCINQ